MAAPAAVLAVSQEFFDNVYALTEYEDSAEAADVFDNMRASLPRVAASPEGSKIVQKFTMLARTVSAEGPLRDMVKIIWRMVKGTSGSAQYKLCLFYLGCGAILCYLRTSPLAAASTAWVAGIEKWLGKQLTIGGKGVTGEGEGSVNDRIQRFFSTPYLHDFD